MIWRQAAPQPPTVRVLLDDLVNAGIEKLEWTGDRVTYLNGLLVRCREMGIEVGQDFADRPTVSEVDARRLWVEVAEAATAQQRREEAEREAERLAARDRGAGRLELNAQELLQVRGMAQFLAENPDKMPQVWDDDDPNSPLNVAARERARGISMQPLDTR